MATPRTLPTIIIFSAIALTLAAIAAILPSSESKKDIRNLQIEYGTEREPTVTPGEESIFNFLKFRLNPTEVRPLDKIVRSRQPSIKKIITQEGDEASTALTLIRSPVESIITIADNSATILEKLEQSLTSERTVHESSVKSGDLEHCEIIANKRAVQDCRGEIFFQKAIAARDIEICGQIERLELKLRCQNYLNLIP